MSFLAPLEVPEAVSAAAAMIAALDGCLLTGFGRLGPDQTAALGSLSRVCAATPLEQAVAGAVEAVSRNEYVARHFAALAAARAALQGAQYDALRQVAAQSLGRTPPSVEDSPPSLIGESDGPIAVWQESAREWLMEVALAGFKHLEPQTLAPFTATLEQLEGEPSATRLAALLGGFMQELLAAMPMAMRADVPIYRWSDLWTRSLIASLRAPAMPAGRKVSGELFVLGVDLHHHGSLASADVYGLFEEDADARLVRLTLSCYKVDALAGSEIWRGFDPVYEPLIRAISQRKALAVQDLTRLPSGDLLWDGEASLGKAYSTMKLAAERLAPGVDGGLALASVPAADRHPLHVAELVYLEGYTVENGDGVRVNLGSSGVLPLATGRISPASELQAEDIKTTSALLGLLRFDGGAWSVQPLAVQSGSKGGEKFTGSGALEAISKKKKDDTLHLLQERASRLLRKKS
jgi:hypothetical protein